MLLRVSLRSWQSLWDHRCWKDQSLSQTPLALIFAALHHHTLTTTNGREPAPTDASKRRSGQRPEQLPPSRPRQAPPRFGNEASRQFGGIVDRTDGTGLYDDGASPPCQATLPPGCQFRRWGESPANEAAGFSRQDYRDFPLGSPPEAADTKVQAGRSV